MTTKSRSWEYRIYQSEDDFNRTCAMFNDTGMSKKEAIWEAKRFVKNNYDVGMIVKIQTIDCEQIEIYTARNQYGQIIFSKKV